MFFVLLSLIAVSVFGFIFPDSEISEKENRALQQLPIVNFEKIKNGSYMEEIEAYLSDQFIFRDEIVAVNNFIDRFLGRTEFNGVYSGKNNRLFEIPSVYDGERVGKAVSAINYFSQSCGVAHQNIILVPNSTEILSAELPAYLELASQKQQIETIYSALSSEIFKVDAITTLENCADKSGLYFKTDHHWTSSAAYEVFLVYAQMLGINASELNFTASVVSDSFYGTLSASSGIYEEADNLEVIIPENIAGTFFVQNYDTLTKTSSVFDLSKLQSSNQYDLFFGGNFSKIQISTKNLNGKKLLVIKDSYANNFVPFLIPFFEKIVIVDPRYFSDNIYDVLSDNGFSHLLFLYNVNTFLEDTVLVDMIY